MVDKVVRRTRGGLVSALARRTRGEELPTPDTVPMETGWAGDSSLILDILKSAPKLVDRFRHGDHVHVSDTLKACFRKIALARMLKVSMPTTTLSEGQGLTFAQGHAVHDYIKRRFIAAAPRAVWGKWSCVCKQTVIGPCTYSARGKNTKCPACGTEAVTYEEVSLYSAEYDLVGNPDLILWLDQYQAYYPVEIKSMAAAQWKELSRPVPDHALQLSFYWYLMRAAKMPVVEGSSLLYANKEFSFKSPYKEIVVLQPETQKRLTPYFEDLKVLKEAKTGGPLPPRIMCATQDAPQAKECPLRATCFQC